MTISYKTWFSVKLIHEFFNHGIINDCVFEPPEDTKQNFFTGTNWLYRFIDDTLYVLIKENGTGLPAVPIPTDKFFRFYLTSNNYLFFNYTDIDMRLSKGYVLYLSNYANNKIDTSLNLSKPIPAYSGYPLGYTFYPGDLITDGAGVVHECVFQSTNNLPANANFWLRRSNKQYVSSVDILRVSTANYQNTFTDEIIDLNAIVRGFKVSGNVLAEYNALTVNQSFSMAVKNVQVDLSLLSPGRYKIVLSATKKSDHSVIIKEEIIYYDPVINFKKALAVVEIFNCISATDNYALQENTTNKILEKGYVISFANRIAWWNYISKTTAVTGINSTVSGLTFANPDSAHKQLFVSNIPLPFVKQFDYTAFTVSGPSPPQIIPWPSPLVLKSEIDSHGLINKVFTEIYLNY